MTSARIPEEDACHRARNLCVFSRIQKGTQGLTHKGCVLQLVSLGALSDITVVLGMRQSILDQSQMLVAVAKTLIMPGLTKHANWLSATVTSRARLKFVRCCVPVCMHCVNWAEQDE